MRIIIAFSNLSVAAVKLCIGLLLALYRQQSVTVQTRSVVGKGLRPIDLKVFRAKGRPLANVDIWFHYLKGDFDLIGPKALSLRETQRLDKDQFARFEVAPGLINPYDVKRRSGIAHGDERVLASEFAKNASWVRRAQILIAAIFHRVIGNATKDLPVPESINLFDVEIDNVSMESAINSIMHRVSHRHISNHARQFSFVNADCVNKYVNNSGYRQVLNSCERVFADGIGLRIAARWQRAQLKDNVNGTDLFPLLCQQLDNEKRSVFLVGSRPEVLDKVMVKMGREYPNLRIAGSINGYSGLSSNAIIEEINTSGAELVFVALGAPLQEAWIASNKEFLNANAAIGVGGLFDFYSGSVSRAPEWVRELSMEWVWRLMAQPKDKAERYLIGNPKFLARVLFSRAAQGRRAEYSMQNLEVS